MGNAEDKIFQEALAAIEEGNNTRAKDLLTRLLKQNQQNPQYWLWMSAVVRSNKERRYCLNQVLQFDPQNADARRGLTLLGDLPLDDSLRVPLQKQQRKWTVPEIAGLESEKVKISWLRMILAVAALAVVIGLVFVAISSNRLWIFQNRQVAVLGTAQSTPTFPATNTPTITVTVRNPTATPPWMALVATYTPTPLYVNTPHPIIEAYQIAVRRYQRGDWQQSIQYFNQALETEKNSPDLYYLLGEAYRQNGQLAEALGAYNQSIQIDPQFAPPYLGRARIALLSEPEFFNEITRDLDKAIQIDPQMGEAYLELANIQFLENNWQDAQLNLEEAAIYLPDSPYISIATGKIALLQKDYAKAIEYAKLANQQDQTVLVTYRFLGEVYQAAGQISDSLEPLTIYSRYAPKDDPQAIAWLGKAYAASGDSDEALKLFAQALKNDRYAVDIYMQRGQLYFSSEKYDLAFDDFSTAFKLKPYLFEACMMKGETQLKLGGPGNAYIQLSECQKLAETDSELARMFFYRAVSLEALKNDVAVQDWERMLNLPPEAIEPEWLATAQAFMSVRYSPTPSLTGTITPRTTQTPSKTSPPPASSTTLTPDVN